VHEILRNLAAGSRVLDLGCAGGSFPPASTAATVVRLDRDAPRGRDAMFVRGDAASLPFANGAFAAIVSNHSLEHFDDLDGALREIGRVIGRGGALYVGVPDAATLTDRLYRWLGRGGGHVNAFTSAAKLAEVIERATGLKLVATRTLCSSLSFLNRKIAPRPLPLRMWLVGGGYQQTLFLWAWLSRRLDRWFGTRSSVYGWALYFGAIAEPAETATWVNVCIRCGSGYAADFLRSQGLVRGMLPALRIYRCPQCGAANPFTG